MPADRGDARITVRTLLPLAECLRALLKVSREEVADEPHRFGAPVPSQSAAEALGDTSDAVVGTATGHAPDNRCGVRRHDGSNAQAGYSQRSKGASC
ncbi:hypothetical protein [Azospirillum sp. TSA2s]|uniref:hypothetical protein n=1 Tax=Azospirillum sp. TSA2s TaxID=709810 RepID=UPI003528D333